MESDTSANCATDRLIKELFSSKRCETILVQEKHNIMMQQMYGEITPMFDYWVQTSVTRLGDILNFGQLFKAFGNN